MKILQYMVLGALLHVGNNFIWPTSFGKGLYRPHLKAGDFTMGSRGLRPVPSPFPLLCVFETFFIHGSLFMI